MYNHKYGGECYGRAAGSMGEWFQKIESMWQCPVAHKELEYSGD